MNHKRNDNQISVVSIIRRERKRIKQYATEFPVKWPVTISVFLNMANVKIEHIDETISQSWVSFFVVPSSRFSYVIEDRWEKTEITHREGLLFSLETARS